MEDVVHNALPLTLGAAISPLLITMSVLMLASGAYEKARATAFLLGVLLVLLVIGILGLTLFNNTVAEHNSSNNKTSDLISLIAGIVLLALLVRGLLHRNRPQREKDQSSLLGDSPAIGKAFLTGCGLMLVNFTSLVLYIPMFKEVARAHIDELQKFEVLFLSIVIISITAWLPLVIALLMPKSSQKILTAINHWISRNTRTITNIVLLVFGVYLVLKGSGHSL